MQPIDPKDFDKIIEKHTQSLAEIKAALDGQAGALAELVDEFAKLGVDADKLPPLESLPKEYQEQYLAFSRDLQEIDDILKPRRVKAKPAVRRRRNMV